MRQAFDKYALWSLLLLPLLGLYGCTVEEESWRESVSIDACIADTGSRTSMAGSKASFTSGDNIGVFETLTGQSNISYTYNGTAWSASSIMYWRNSTLTHSFYAYYPYNATSSGMKVSIPVLSPQSITVISAVPNTPDPTKDLLVAGPQNMTRTPGVTLAFKHAFALIQFNIKKNSLLNLNQLDAITINGGNTAGSTNRFGIVNTMGSASQVGYDLAAGAVVSDINTSARYAQSITINITGVSLLTTSITLYAFVLPGTYANPVPSASFKASVLGLLSATSSSVPFPNTSFEAGKKYVYDVTINSIIRSAADVPEVTLVPRAVIPMN